MIVINILKINVNDDDDERNLGPGGRRVQSGAAFQGFLKIRPEIGFCHVQGAPLRDPAGHAGHQGERGVALLDGGQLWWPTVAHRGLPWRTDLTICCH